MSPTATNPAHQDTRMSTVEVRVPTVGESIVEGTLGRWLVEDGAAVERGAPLFELETDKTNTEVPAPASGVLRRAVAAGDVVQVNMVVATIDPSGVPAAAAKPVPPAPAAPPPAATPAPPTAGAPVAPPAASAPPVGTRSSPATPGNGPGPTPVARALMREHGLTEADIPHRGNRIRREDVLAAIAARARAPKPATPTPSATRDPNRPERRVPISPMRRMMMARLVEARHTAAMLTTFNEVDMTAVLDLIGSLGEAWKKRHGAPLTPLVFFVRAAVEAFREIPRANAFIEGDEILTPSCVDVSIGMETRHGHALPVLRDAHRLSVPQIGAALAGLRERAEAGRLALSELVGGTFTIEDDGVHGALLGTPMLNPPQSTVLGLHRIVTRPVAVAGKLELRPMMYLALSYDHRLLDGRDAVLFLGRIKECIERPERMLLEV